MKRSLIIFISLFIFLSCKKEDNCSWANSILDGNTFSISSIKIKSNLTDVTTKAFEEDPCLRNKITFSGANYLTIKSTNCDSTKSGTWLAKTIGNQKQLELYNTVFDVTENTCNTFTIEAYLSTGSYTNTLLLFTYTKQ